jgi:hypothetical protein
MFDYMVHDQSGEDQGRSGWAVISTTCHAQRLSAPCRARRWWLCLAAEISPCSGARVLPRNILTLLTDFQHAREIVWISILLSTSNNSSLDQLIGFHLVGAVV